MDCRKIAARVLAILLFACAGWQAVAQEYRLVPGDRVQITFFGIPDGTAQAMVDDSGFVRLPILGAIEAGGLTIDELRQKVSRASLGQTITVMGLGGNQSIISLDGLQIHTEILEYRPVLVAGDVLRPGEVSYTPRMTLRAALAKAGGISTIAELEGSELGETSERLTSYKARSAEYARQVASLWRVETLLNPENPPDRPDPDTLPVPQALAEAIIRLEEERLEQQRTLMGKDRADLSENILRLEGVDALISEQIEQQREAVAIEESEVERLTDLNDRGLVNTTRASERKRFLALTASQLLETQSEQLEIAGRLAAFRQELSRIDDTERAALLAEKAELEQDVTELRIQLDGLRELLGLRGAETGGEDGESRTEVTIFRDLGDATVIENAPLSERVLPGDVVEVRVKSVF